MNKSNLGEKGLYVLYVLITVHHERKQYRNPSRNLEAGTAIEATEECSLLACFPQLAQPAFLYHSGP